jgi:hypothetical protein
MIGEFCPKVFALNLIRGARAESSYRDCCRRVGNNRHRFSVPSFIHSKKIPDRSFHNVSTCALVSAT